MSTDERAVLGLLLEHHPGLLSIDEVVRFLTPESGTFADRDAVHAAIRALVEVGLVHQLDHFVFATAAAIFFDRLGGA